MLLNKLQLGLQIFDLLRETINFAIGRNICDTCGTTKISFNQLGNLSLK